MTGCGIWQQGPDQDGGIVMAKKSRKDSTLTELIAAAPPEALSELILNLAADSPKIRRACFDYLKENTTVSSLLEKKSEGEAVMAIWAELLPDLEDLNAYGGADYDVEEQVWKLLAEITKRLESKTVDAESRRELLESVLPFIESGNSGATDALNDLVYAACYNDHELRRLAEHLEAMDDDWQTRMARNLYLQIGDHEKYLELRLKQMVTGSDYLDLALFYRESGELEKSLQTAQKGLKKATGRMDELRMFVAERALEAGDREGYLALRFDQATDHLTLDTYNAFQAICTAEEWERYEPRVLKKLKYAGSTEKIKIFMGRKEYEKVIAILAKDRYPISNWDSSVILQIAEKLENHYPEKILKWYLSGLGNLSSSQNREEYARKAKVMAKVRHVLVNVIKDDTRWKKLALKVKNDNLRRPAFQQEFAHIVPGWKEL
jgi:hypothetical protein